VRQFNDVVGSSPTIADIDRRTAGSEAVFSTGSFYNDDNIDSHQFGAVHLDDSSDAFGTAGVDHRTAGHDPRRCGASWPTTPAGPTWSSGDRDGAVYAFRGNGALSAGGPASSQPGGHGNSGSGFRQQGDHRRPTLTACSVSRDPVQQRRKAALLIRGGTNGSLIANVGDQRFASVSAPAIVDFRGTQGRQPRVIVVQPTGPLVPAR
jgi:hypothetical protein